MKKYTNYSGLCQKINEELGVKETHETDNSKQDFEYLEIKTDEITTNSAIELPTSIDYKNIYLDEIMQKLEILRENDKEAFNDIINLNKELLAAVSYYENKESLKIIEEIYSEVDYSGFLYWSAIRALKIAILKIRKFELIHFFIVRQSMKLSDYSFKNILNEYFDSLSGEDFINCEDDEKIFNYCNILHILIADGEADVNNYDNSGVGNSILQTVILHKQYQFILFLLNNTNVDINYVNKEIKTALDICYEKIEDVVYEEIFNLLIPYGAEAVLHKRDVKKYLN